MSAPDHSKQVCLSLLLSLVGWLASAPSAAAVSGAAFSAVPLKPDGTIESRTEQRTSASSKNAAERGDAVSIIVKLRGEPLAAYRGGLPGLPASGIHPDANRVDVASSDSQSYLKHLAGQRQSFEAAALRAAPKSRIVHRFDIVLNGVSMLLPADQVAAVSSLPDVEAVYPDELLHLDTDSSPEFIGAPATWEALGGSASAGEGVVVGVLDTGVWPEHPSFSDPDPAGKAYQPLTSWHGTRCEFGSAVTGDAPFSCNNKLLGAARFMSTYDQLETLEPDEFISARDDDGHGTHTASTAAGNGGVGARLFGVPRGKISGIAPRARVTMYKVCGRNGGCYASDSAAAVQQAIADGVNVINFSISGGRDPYADPVSLAFLDAYKAGVFVAVSAGNDGPAPDTVNHREPWVSTVAASTQTRAFANTVRLTADGGATLALQGTSLTAGVALPKPVAIPPDPDCVGPYGAGTFAGRIVVCRRGGVLGRVQKGFNVRQGGAVGMILYNQSAAVTDVETDNHFLPASHLHYADGQALLAFLSSHSNVRATLSKSVKTASTSDVLASFSSRGAPAQSLGISKPDLTAPGVQILAGHTPLPGDPAGGPQGELFQAIAGTSMSSPHVAGAGALLRDLHPNWTPGQIRSALMLTAKTRDVFKEDGIKRANAFDYGSGRIDLNRAGTAPLTFDASGAEFVDYQDDLWNANYPSLYVPAMPGALTVKRTVHNEKARGVTWRLNVSAPKDIDITVPSEIFVKAKSDASFNITIDGSQVPIGKTRMATLSLVNDTLGTLNFPITFVRKPPLMPLATMCKPASLPKGGITDCTITVANRGVTQARINVTARLPAQLRLVPGSVTGATPDGNGIIFSGIVPPAKPARVSLADNAAWPFEYAPLSGFGFSPIGGVGDETVTNFTVPEFLYGGETYTRIGMASNGYLIVGGGSATDIRRVNQSLPNRTTPNNVLAPFWTDLKPDASGGMRAGWLTDGTHDWFVFDWENVANAGNNTLRNSFQVWIPFKTNSGTLTSGFPTDKIFFFFRALTNGKGGKATIGAENRLGNRGAQRYYNGTGSLPAPDSVLLVNSTAGAARRATIAFKARGARIGSWTNQVEMTSSQFSGFTNVKSFAGEVTAP